MPSENRMWDNHNSGSRSRVRTRSHGRRLEWPSAVTRALRRPRQPSRSRDSRGQRMQDIDHPAQIQALPQPARARRPRVQAEPLCVVPRPERLNRIGGYCGRRRDLRKGPAIWSPEPERAVRLSIDLVALLVDSAMVPTTQQREVRQRRRAALRPVLDVMALAEGHPAAREAAAAVPVVQRAPQGRRNRASPRADHSTPNGLAEDACARTRDHDRSD